MSTAPVGLDPYDVTRRSNGLRRRRLVEKAFGVLAILSALLACAVLAVVLGTVLYKGFSQLSLDFFVKPRPLFGERGGIADALVGSTLIVGMAMLIAVPVSVLVAIFMSEYAGPRLSTGLRIVLDVLNGVPAIVVGIFVFGLLVVGRGQSAVFGAFALAVLMLPMVARATQEVLEIVRDPITVFISLLMPLIMLFLFGYAMSFDVEDAPLYVIDHDKSVASRALAVSVRMRAPRCTREYCRAGLHWS